MDDFYDYFVAFSDVSWRILRIHLVSELEYAVPVTSVLETHPSNAPVIDVFLTLLSM